LIGIVLFCNPVYIDVFAEDYQGLGPGQGIGLVSSSHIELLSFRLVMIVDRETNLIQVDFSPFFLNGTKSGIVAITLPYPGTLDENTDWEMKSFERNTVLIKKYYCSEEEPCQGPPREFFNFVVDGKLDSKTLSHHIVGFEIWNSAPPSEEYDYILPFLEGDRQYDLGFRKIRGGEVILIIENTAINLSHNPTATIDRFENQNTGYENKQLVWDISEIKYAEAEYNIETEPNVLPDLRVLESIEVKETVDFVGQEIILPIIVGIIVILLGAALVRYFFQNKGNLKIEDIEFRTYDFHGMNLHYVSAKLGTSHEKVVKDIEVVVEVKKDEKPIKMRSFEYHKDEHGERKNEKSIEWDQRGVDWFKDLKFNNMKDKLEQIRKGEEWYFKFPAHGIWFAGVGIGTSSLSSYEYGVDVKKDEKYKISITIRGTDISGTTLERKKNKTVLAN